MFTNLFSKLSSYSKKNSIKFSGFSEIISGHSISVITFCFSVNKFKFLTSSFDLSLNKSQWLIFILPIWYSLDKLNVGLVTSVFFDLKVLVEWNQNKNGLSGFKHRVRNKVQKLISKVTATLNVEVHWECLMYVSVLQTFWLQVLATFKCPVIGRSNWLWRPGLQSHRMSDLSWHFNCMLDSLCDASALHLSLKLKLNAAVSVYFLFLFLSSCTCTGHADEACNCSASLSHLFSDWRYSSE